MTQEENVRNVFRKIFSKPRTVVTVVILALVFAVLSMGFYKVEPGEQGVIRRFGKLSRVTDEGLHLMIPIIEHKDTPQVQQIRRVEVGYRTIDQGPPAQYRNMPEEALMLTGDENIVDVNITAQYRISDPVKYLFNVYDVDRMVRQVSEAALRQIIGSHTIDDVLAEGKEAIQFETRDKIQELFDKYDCGLLCISTQLQDVIAPQEVDSAFKDVASAREDRERMIREAEGYENQIVPIARGEAERMVKDAQADSLERVERSVGDVARFLAVYDEYRKQPDVTRSRLYIETMEEILPGLRKYIIDSGGGGNITNVLGLPEALSGEAKGGESK